MYRFIVLNFNAYEHFLLVPQLSNAGGRLIIASDGIWDALSSDMAAKSCRGVPAELAAKLVVKVMVNGAIFLSFFRNGCFILSTKCFFYNYY